MKFTRLSVKKYWQKRIKGNSDLGASGHRSLSTQYNWWIYKRRLETLTSMLQYFSLNSGNISILDVGCGNGFFTALWNKKQTKQYVGIDISKEAIKELSTVYPSYTFQIADITLPEPLANSKKTFDLITVFDVLYHIVDENEFKIVLNNLSKMLSPNGYIFVFDQLANKQIRIKDHVIYRKRAHVYSALGVAGLKVVKTEKLFAFLAPPVFGNFLVDTIIALLYKVSGIFMKMIPQLGNFLGKIIYSIDNVLLSNNVSPPNHELFVIRKK